MKSRMLITNVILILVIFILIGNYAIGNDEYVPTENEEIYGTWVNPNYTKVWFPQKIIIKPDGVYEYYISRLDLVPTYQNTYTLTDKWIDSEGNVCYRMIWKWKGTAQPRFELDKFSNLEQTWEFINSFDDYPTEIDSNHPDYHIYYRQ